MCWLMKNDKQVRDFVKEYRIQYIPRLRVYLQIEYVIISH
jgi:hypothetical protein